MIIPDYFKTSVPPDLITGYLLNKDHPLGKIKAEYLNKQGFTFKNRDKLLKQILLFPKKYVYSNFENVYNGGMVYKVTYNGNIICPNGSSFYLSTLWLLNITSENLKLLTISVL